jgi:hypothetical protein
MSHNQFPPPQQCREWSDVDHEGRILEFSQHFQELCSLWSQCVFIANWCAIGLEPGMPLKPSAYDSRFGPRRFFELLWGFP